jgi:putative transposase
MQKKQNKTRKQIAKHNRNLSDVAMGQFATMLKYKASWLGTNIEYAGEFQATTTICHVCGYKLQQPLSTKIRIWKCPQCGTTHDRDKNASKVIKLVCKDELPVYSG